MYILACTGTTCTGKGEPCTAKIKVYIRNTWDWLTVQLRKSDVDYVVRHCGSMKQSSPTLQKRGKEWFLDFLYTGECTLTAKKVRDQVILAVDLGINNACTCVCLLPDGTVAGRRFLRLPAEEDCLKRLSAGSKGHSSTGPGRHLACGQKLSGSMMISR